MKIWPFFVKRWKPMWIRARNWSNLETTDNIMQKKVHLQVHSGFSFNILVSKKSEKKMNTIHAPLSTENRQGGKGEVHWAENMTITFKGCSE